MRKVTDFVISIFMDMEAQDIGPEYHDVLNQCRLMTIYLWTRLTKIKSDYKITIRSKNLVKDQLKVNKSKMIDKFLQFWNKFKDVGETWSGLNQLSKVFNQFIKYGKETAIDICMEMIADTI